MKEEAIIDELTRLAKDWALEEEPVGSTAEATEEADVEGEREVSAVYGYFSDDDRLDFAYGADYLLIEPEDEEDEDFDDEEFGETEEE